MSYLAYRLPLRLLITSKLIAPHVPSTLHLAVLLSLKVLPTLVSRLLDAP